MPCGKRTIETFQMLPRLPGRASRRPRPKVSNADNAVIGYSPYSLVNDYTKWDADPSDPANGLQSYCRAARHQSQVLGNHDTIALIRTGIAAEE